MAGAAALLLAGCAGAGSQLDERASAVVYGQDDRRELFTVADPEERQRIAGGVVAIVPKSALRDTPDGVGVDVPTWGQAAGLCAGEPFADQPAAALCTGVLVDWDLVLTAGHCVRVLPLDELVVVFDYAYGVPGVLGPLSETVEVAAVVDEALDGAGTAPRRDYAWLRLARTVTPARRPVAVPAGWPASLLGQPILAVGTGGGAPFKVDDGGIVRDERASSRDYFIADTDTSRGSSGSAAFDEGGVLIGILARGADDLTLTDAGCFETRHEDGREADEECVFRSIRAARSGVIRALFRLTWAPSERSDGVCLVSERSDG